MNIYPHMFYCIETNLSAGEKYFKVQFVQFLQLTCLFKTYVSVSFLGLGCVLVGKNVFSEIVHSKFLFYSVCVVI